MGYGWGDDCDKSEVIRGCKNEGPSEYDTVEFGPDHLQQLRVEEVLTQAEGAPVTSAHAAQPGVAEETPTHSLNVLHTKHTRGREV